MPDVGADQLDAFRAEVRGWIKANFPAALKGRNPMEFQMTPAAANDPDFQSWRAAMADKGWGAATWPKDYGGGGLSRGQAKVLDEELARAGAFNPIGGMGMMMFGPTLLEYGSAEQKARFIPPIVRGEVRWCQGFSEPGAGSDLASLQTRCEDKGDHFLVNGQKIWTSGANYADWCFCLVRTDTTRKHEGISFLLIDMKSPGVETRPIRLISGASPFCETFFTDVKVPKDQLVGPLNGGWSIAKRLLEHERQGIGSRPAGVTPDLAAMAKRYVGEDGEGRLADGDLRGRVSSHLMAAHALKQTLSRTVAEAKSGAGPNAAVSILKNAGTSVAQERLELSLEIMGLQGLGWEGAAFTESELEIVRTWLGSKAYSIYGGSAEIQNNIIAKRVLGLLDHQ
ncbi:MAG TPA: acyl-CoA dehydrogenase family protein [Caulobacteraceae bacterium]|nr:acyl-CoA dehydrogenase family protein [Caulobacteraceae bacterium]